MHRPSPLDAADDHSSHRFRPPRFVTPTLDEIYDVMPRLRLTRRRFPGRIPAPFALRTADEIASSPGDDDGIVRSSRHSVRRRADRRGRRRRRRGTPPRWARPRNGSRDGLEHHGARLTRRHRVGELGAQRVDCRRVLRAAERAHVVGQVRRDRTGHTRVTPTCGHRPARSARDAFDSPTTACLPRRTRPSRASRGGPTSTRCHDVRLVLFEQERRERVHSVHDAQQVDAEDRVPVVERGLPLIPDRGDAGVVADHVDPSERVDGASASSATDSGSLTSVGTVTTSAAPSAPLDRTRSATDSSRPGSMSASTSFMPAATNASAIPRPSPLPPPVTTATRPDTFFIRRLASYGRRLVFIRRLASYGDWLHTATGFI